MALPAPLRSSVIPQELELIASEQLVEVIPLVAMERTAFISVRIKLSLGPGLEIDLDVVGGIRSLETTYEMQSTHLDGC